ncbi:MAG: PIG-L family deacetylase [Gemmatimonadota bacterium]
MNLRSAASHVVHRWGRRSPILLLLLLAWAETRPLAAQIPDAGGATRVAELLRGLDGVKRVLMIGAHPDDEDTSLLAALARGQGVEAAYLALTRGEGGQNLIGPELFEGLGVVRTGELLAARELDGAHQFFTRAFDFGFSKSADEALALWPREKLLADVVWVVRTYRPQVIVSVFTGTPADGHGQHQAAGIMAQEAFVAAADPQRFPEQLQLGARPWQASKLYGGVWRNPEGASVTVATGVIDPLSGRSYYQIAMASRSQHRSQDMGVAQILGPSESGLALMNQAAGVEVGSTLFAGVDTALVSLADASRMSGEGAAHLRAYRQGVQAAEDALRPEEPSQALPGLLAAVRHLELARAAASSGSALSDELAFRSGRLDEAALAAAGVVVDARSSRDRLVPGETFRVDLEVWNGGAWTATGVAPEIELPEGARARPVVPPPPPRRFGPPEADAARGERTLGDWSSRARGEARTLAAGAFERWSFEIELPSDAPFSRLYYLERPRTGAMYQWPDDPQEWGSPRNREAFPVDVPLTFTAGDETAAVRWKGAVQYRGVNPARGEQREPVLILPAVSVALDPGVLVWPLDRRDPRTVQVTLESHAPDVQDGTVRLELPAGWTAEPESWPYRLERTGSRASFAFEVVPPAAIREGEQTIHAFATASDGRAFAEAVTLVDYEHIRRNVLLRPSDAILRTFPVKVAQGLTVGYVMGTGDSGPAAIRELGIEPHLITTDDLAAGDLGRFDVIVLGVRAYEARPDLVQYNESVLDFVRRGGVLISQYNQYDYTRPGIAPYPVQISRPHDRVTDETAAVRLLQPDHPLVATPNRIGPSDFEGWVQERGLYFLGEWDDHWTPLLEMADPGEEPKQGSLLVSRVGEGLYVYTGLAFFRQLPAGVPGAYRLLANLISVRPNLVP